MRTLFWQKIIYAYIKYSRFGHQLLAKKFNLMSKFSLRDMVKLSMIKFSPKDMVKLIINW
jgi:hypothetical protein